LENEGSGEVCLEETVERLRREGLSDAEIAERLGLDVAWVSEVVSRSGGGEEA